MRIEQLYHRDHCLLRAGERELQAPISAGEVLGEVTVRKNGVVYGTASLVAGAMWSSPASNI
jgi:hypothetical protein